MGYHATPVCRNSLVGTLKEPMITCHMGRSVIKHRKIIRM